MKVLFLDESGDHSLAKIDPQYPLFVLGGIIVAQLVTLVLTLFLPPAPPSQHSLADIALVQVEGRATVRAGAEPGHRATAGRAGAGAAGSCHRLAWRDDRRRDGGRGDAEAERAHARHQERRAPDAREALEEIATAEAEALRVLNHSRPRCRSGLDGEPPGRLTPGVGCAAWGGVWLLP